MVIRNIGRIHVISYGLDNSRRLRAPSGNSNHHSEDNMFLWTAGTETNRDGSLSSFFKIQFLPAAGPEPKTIKVTVTFYNRRREAFEETFCAETSTGFCVHFDQDKNTVGRGRSNERVSLKHRIEISGVFPKVEKPFTKDFWSSDPDLNDLVLVAGEQKFHVNKAILTTYSPYFKELLATGNGEYELEDIAPRILQELLQVIYHVPEIYDDNVEELLKAARQLDVPLVTRQCKDFLDAGSDRRMVQEERQRLIEEFGLENLAQIPVIQKNFGIRGELDDMVLKVEDQRFHINRQILATHSSYFYTIFFGRFRRPEQSEVELKFVDPATFQQLLEVLYHCPNINENNVDNLFNLARLYDVKPVTEKCQKFINERNALRRY